MSDDRHLPAASVEGPGFVQLLWDLYRRRLLLFLAVALGYLAIAGLWIAHWPYTYRAEAIVDLAPRSTQIADIRDVVERSTPDEGAIGAELSYLRSRAFTDDLLSAFHETEPDLYRQIANDPEQAQTLASPLYRAVLSSSVAQEIAPPSESELRDRFRRDLAVERLEKSSAVGIAFRAHDPELAAVVANKAAEFYVGQQTRSKETVARRARTQLEAETDQLRAEIARIEAEIERVRDQAAITADPSSNQLNEMAALTGELLDVRSQRQALEAQVRLLANVADRTPSAAMIVSVMPTPILQELRAQEAALARQRAEAASMFGPKHPRILQLAADTQLLESRIQAEVDAGKARAMHEIKVLAAREAGLEQQIAQLRQQEAGTRRTLIDVRELERQRDARIGLLEKALGRLKETEMQQAMIEGDAKLLSPSAIPLHRDSPQLGLLLGINLLAALLFASGGTLLVEQLDGRLRTREQLHAWLGLQVLAWVPSAPLRRYGSPLAYLLAKPASAYAEAIQSLRAALRVQVLRAGHRTVAVTSSFPQEGKTTLAHSLALSAARVGLRTALVDLDLRKPQLHQMLDRPIEAGVEEFLAGQASLNAVVQPSSLDERLTLLPVHRCPPNPADLIQGERLGRLIAALRQDYELVVVDTPPVMQLSDAPAIAEQVDAVLFAVHWCRTPRAAAEMAVARLREAGANLIGAVFTQVDIKSSRKSMSSNPYYYYRRYRSYYAE